MKAIIIEKVGDDWGLVNMTWLVDDAWHCGENFITSLEDVVKRADEENIPIFTRKYFESLQK